MKICFRVDASLLIGTGHVMRCLTLADALNCKGIECYFICREHAGSMILQISDHGYKVFPFPVNKLETKSDRNSNSYSHWLGETWQTDAAQTRSVLEKLKPDWLVVDHYSLDEQWESTIRTSIAKVMVIDDLADRVHDCDLLLDQTYGRTEDDYRSLVPVHCTRLTGSRYALLRPEFAELREYSLQRRMNAGLNRILITMGGIDKDNSTGKVLAVLKQCEPPNNLCTTVVMGQNSPWLSSVKELAAEMPWATEVLVNVKDMARKMADSDLCIGAAGSTIWECCCLGLPTLILVLADNQRLVARSLQDAGAVRLLGTVSDIDEKFNSAMVDMKNREILTEMSHLASMITNGQGTEQVVQHMECIQ